MSVPSDWAGISTLSTPPFSPAFLFLPHVPAFPSQFSRSSFLQHSILFSHSVCITVQCNTSRKQKCYRVPSLASASVRVAANWIAAYSKVLTAEISPWLLFHALNFAFMVCIPHYHLSNAICYYCQLYLCPVSPARWGIPPWKAETCISPSGAVCYTLPSMSSINV